MRAMRVDQRGIQRADMNKWMLRTLQNLWPSSFGKVSAKHLIASDLRCPPENDVFFALMEVAFAAFPLFTS